MILLSSIDRDSLVVFYFLGLPTPSPTPTSATCFKCASGSPACIDLKKKCDFTNDCTDNSDETTCGWPCYFQSDMCGWANSKLDNFDWRRHKGCTGSFNTGPCKDADNSTSGELNTYCFSFAYQQKLSYDLTL